MRGKLVVVTVPGEKCHRNFVVLKDVDRCRRVAPWSERVDCCNWHVAFEFLKTSSANNGNAYGVCNLSIAVTTRYIQVLTIK